MKKNTFNKGEWSELYVFLKLLSDKKLFAADKNLNKIENIYYPIIKILREDKSGKLEYYTNSKVKIYDSKQNLLAEIPVQKFKENSLLLLEKIKTGKGSSFKIEEISRFLKEIKISNPKTKSSEKKDITIVVHDIFTGFTPKLGFSIKSRLGGSSTLLNASRKTNFIYSIYCKKELLDNLIKKINNISTRSKIKDRVRMLNKNGCFLKFENLESRQFYNNLLIIDSALPVILAEMLKLYYLGKKTKVSDLTKLLTKANPLNFDSSAQQPFYEYKIKNFLTDTALGMTPSSTWKGIYDANGGYIIVKENGEVVCYHIYNRNDFQEYLFRNTKFETPASSPKRNNFGIIYQKNNSYFIKLNLQIRFIR